MQELGRYPDVDLTAEDDDTCWSAPPKTQDPVPTVRQIMHVLEVVCMMESLS